MKELILSLNKEDVYNEVAKTTSYTGAKMEDDKAAYARIFTTDGDKEILERFWNESKNAAAGTLKKLLNNEQEENGTYTLTLDISNSFDDSLRSSMERSLFSFFVMNIVSKWYVFTNKKEAGAYAESALSDMEDVVRKAYFKKRPTRPTYD